MVPSLSRDIPIVYILRLHSGALYVGCTIDFEVRFRESFVLTPTYLVVGLLPNADGTSYSGTIILDLLSITSVEPLPLPVNPQGNGQPPG